MQVGLGQETLVLPESLRGYTLTLVRFSLCGFSLKAFETPRRPRWLSRVFWFLLHLLLSLSQLLAMVAAFLVVMVVRPAMLS